MSTQVDQALDALTEHGCRPRRSGDGWQARCPAHADRNPSLSITEGADGRVLLHCHAGCDLDLILKALDLTPADLFPTPNTNGNGTKRRAKNASPRREVARYQYCDNGKLTYEVVRYEPKDFRVRRPDGHGGWTWNVDGIERIPYRFDELRDAIANGKPVYVVEGEKDADSAVSAGAVATTSPGGCGNGKKCWPAFAPHFRGADVTIVADDDQRGYEYAKRVSDSLEGVATTVRVVRARTGKDLTDHLAAGCRLDELDPVDLDTPADNTTDESTDFLTASVLDWTTLREHTEDNPWLIAPLIARGRSHLIVAPTGEGKSLLILWLVVRAALGLRVLGRPAGEPLRVLYVDVENTAADIIDRLDAFGDNLDLALAEAGTLRYCHLPTIANGFDTWRDADELVRQAREHDADLVIIDTAPASVQGPENDSDTWAHFQRLVTTPLKSEGRSVGRVDHTGRDESKGARGSSAKTSDVDIGWQLAKADNGGLTLKNLKGRQAWIDAKVALHRTEDNGRIGWRHVAREWAAGTAEAAEQLDGLGVPVHVTRRDAERALQLAGKGCRSVVVGDAVRYRKELAAGAEQGGFGSGTTPGTTAKPPSGTPREPATKESTEIGAEPLGNHAELGPFPNGNHTPPLKGGVGPTAAGFDQDLNPDDADPLAFVDEQMGLGPSDPRRFTR